MTLILALQCKNGMVLASDSQATFGTTGQEVKASVSKLHTPWLNIAWGGAGHVGLIQLVNNRLRERFSQPNAFERKEIAEVRQKLSTTIAELLRPLISERYLRLPGAQPATACFLFVGHVPQGPFILEVGQDLSDVEHQDIGYGAIGSGDIFPYFALAELKHFNVRQRTLFEAKLLAHRVVTDAINVAARGLGGEVQMVEVEFPPRPGDKPNVKALSGDDLRVLKDKVEEWKALESDTLSQFVGLSPSLAEGNPGPAAPPEAT